MCNSKLHHRRPVLASADVGAIDSATSNAQDLRCVSVPCRLHAVLRILQSTLTTTITVLPSTAATESTTEPRSTSEPILPDSSASDAAGASESTPADVHTAHCPCTCP